MPGPQDIVRSLSWRRGGCLTVGLRAATTLHPAELPALPCSPIPPCLPKSSCAPSQHCAFPATAMTLQGDRLDRPSLLSKSKAALKVPLIPPVPRRCHWSRPQTCGLVRQWHPPFANTRLQRQKDTGARGGQANGRGHPAGVKPLPRADPLLLAGPGAHIGTS